VGGTLAGRGGASIHTQITLTYNNMPTHFAVAQSKAKAKLRAFISK